MLDIGIRVITGTVPISVDGRPSFGRHPDAKSWKFSDSLLDSPRLRTSVNQQYLAIRCSPRRPSTERTDSL